jgi:glycosyltransferase involved in cell wall biosynthesis
MDQPLVSVIIPEYNYAQYLSQAVDSALGQTYPHVEILVVDDGSTDNSPEVIRQYGDRIRSFRQENQGLSAARNTGARLAKGDLLAFLDSDDVWRPRKLELQVRLFQENPKLGLVHCGMEETDAAGATVRVRVDGMEGREGQIADEMLLLRRPAILGAGSTAVVTREAYEATGPFDTRLRHSEDWDFCYRLARRYPIGFVPEALVQYRLHGVNMHHNIGRMEEAMLLCFGKAFADPDPHVRSLRRRAYGRLHMILAGSYFAAGRRKEFVRCALKSLWFTPGSVSRLLGYPLRRFQRARGAEETASLSQNGAPETAA